MQLSVTFRHMDSTEALQTYAKEKVERIRKYFPDPIKAHVVFICDRGYNHTADVMITLHNGLVIKGIETTEDMYSSVDLVMAKIERQVRRYKEKIRSHKGSEGLHGQREITHSVLSVPEEGEAGVSSGVGDSTSSIEGRVGVLVGSTGEWVAVGVAVGIQVAVGGTGVEVGGTTSVGVSVGVVVGVGVTA